MNFSRAFKYPFQNFAKVMSIVLVLTIAFALFIAMILNSYDWSPLFEQLSNFDGADSYAHEMQPMGGTTITGFFGLLLVAIVSGFWLSGYSIEVIRSVMREEEWMPPVAFGQNVKDGALIFASSLAYWLLFIMLIVGLTLVNGLLGQINSVAALAAVASFFFIVGAAFVMGWAYLIGMARFAAEGDYKASWQIGQNMRLARANWRNGLTLVFYMIAFSILYGAVRSAVDGIFGGLMGMNMLAGITLSIIIYYIFNLMQHFSTQVLVAQYAGLIGIGSDHYDPEKEKVDTF